MQSHRALAFAPSFAEQPRRPRQLLKLCPGGFTYNLNKPARDVDYVASCFTDLASVLAGCTAIETVEIDTEHHCLLLACYIPSTFWARVTSLHVHSEGTAESDSLTRVLTSCVNLVS